MRSAPPASPLPVRHVTASAGLVSDGVAAYDGVRPGLALYGLVPDDLSRAQLDTVVGRGLRPVLSLHARPVRVADLPAGWGVSYGPTFVTARPSRIATLPLGYGDGWSRALSNRAEALVRGRRVPIVGNVAMDAIMVDVTDVPGPPVTPADEFTLIGSQGARADHRRRVGASAQHELVGGRDGDGSPTASGVRCGVRTGRSANAHRAELIQWHASNSGTATSATSRSTRSSTPRTSRSGCRPASAARSSAPAATPSSSRPSARRPSPLGGAIVTGGGTLPVKAVIHAVSLDRERRTSGAVIEAAVRSAMARGPRARRHEHRVPGARDRCRRLPDRRGRRDHRPHGARGTALVPYHLARDLRPARPAAYEAFAAALSAGQPVANGAA